MLCYFVTLYHLPPSITLHNLTALLHISMASAASSENGIMCFPPFPFALDELSQNHVLKPNQHILD